MAYIFRGRLCGFICTECPEPLSNVQVRLYRSRPEQNVTLLAVANPKDTSIIVTDEQIKEKASSLLAETEADSDGAFSFELGEPENYHGEAFEVDIYCGTVPGQKIGLNPPKPLQFTITMLQPLWRQNEQGFFWAWEYCLSSRFWCALRALFGALVICGHVTICNAQEPVAGVKVTAFDADWFSDDPLGTAMTDGAGKFRIDYTHQSFLQSIGLGTLFPNESGPDVHFRIEDAGGVILLDEPHARGRQADRQDVGACFCVELCVDVQPTKTTYPWFTHVGDFNIYSDIDAVTGKTSRAAPSGSTAHGGPGFGFYDGAHGGLKLIGFCPKTHPVNGQPMRYRFLYEDPSNPGVKVPLAPGQISSCVVGTRLIQWKLFDDNLVTTFQSIIVANSGATPDPTPTPVIPGPWGSVPDHVIVPDANGWIPVDQNAIDDGFNGPLIRFVSSSAVPGGAAPGSGAGTLPVSPKSGVALALYFEAAPVGDPVVPATLLGNNLNKLLINNWTEVNELDLYAGGNCCAPLTATLNIRYTVDHELIRSWGISISSCASSQGWVSPSLPNGTTPRGQAGIDTENISNNSAWPSCSYAVNLTTVRSVTDGETDDSGRSNQELFFK